jgi:hypothetical protein
MDWSGVADAEGLEAKVGWGGRIRTFTILINSEVSYRLDHAPAGFAAAASGRAESSKSGLQRKESDDIITWGKRGEKME